MTRHLDEYRAAAGQVAAFRAEHGRWPRHAGRDVGPDEARLGRWLRWQRAMRAPDSSHPVTPQRRAIYDELIPGWDADRIDTRARARQSVDGTCAATGCDRPIVARRLCTRHYQAVRRGDTVALEEASPTTPGTRPAYASPDGHGRYGILDHDDEGRVLCHDCGLWWSHLSTHVRYSHGTTAAAYRSAHGLSPGLPLVGTETAETMRARWEDHRDLHTTVLAESRDPAKANAASRRTRGRAWSAQEIAERIEAGKARGGRALTDAEVAQLGDVTDIPAWVTRARALLAAPDISLRSIADASGLATATVAQRLRRYPT